MINSRPALPSFPNRIGHLFTAGIIFRCFFYPECRAKYCTKTHGIGVCKTIKITAQWHQTPLLGGH